MTFVAFRSGEANLRATPTLTWAASAAHVGIAANLHVANVERGAHFGSLILTTARVVVTSATAVTGAVVVAVIGLA